MELVESKKDKTEDASEISQDYEHKNFANKLRSTCTSTRVGMGTSIRENLKNAGYGYSWPGCGTSITNVFL